MRPIRELTRAQARAVKVVCMDIDDTLTENGRLLDEAFHSLWVLRSAGITLVPVTGRPAGWCDMITRQWPVDAVVGENGAFVYYLEGGVRREFVHPSIPAASVRSRLSEVSRDVIARIPGARVSKDQAFRLYDLAIDFREEPPYLGLEEAERIASVCREHGAECKVSSIHVNTWFGEYDKLAMVRLFLEQFLEIDTAMERCAVLFCGDSPNDEPMFSHFDLSCGVANVREMLHLMSVKPHFVTSASHGRGFAEMARTLLHLREP